MTVQIRGVAAADETEWSRLYAGYRAFYQLDNDPQAVQTTWEWVSTAQHGFVGLVATIDGTVVGLANLRRFARPSTAALGLYLDDLFTAPEARGAGVATALLREAAAIAAGEGAKVVRWITSADNAAARSVYDKVATATSWVTYDMAPAPH
ncbi:GNAT family N-acetyltransferase [Aeromicrobium phragmitis]|uniref:GNAT family N-acetyltransferase n=1 Tax=Aeromicrobium phragmitis TaxID=2478914 RepID=A0A3L8PPK1_9ACTN|nr:GNAT family N-acetyltransferase [Aeromicrobium phragmitis]RLV57316.1 GNAT family N-acetyltransferase [Aeromicrobium phragmitis]